MKMELPILRLVDQAIDPIQVAQDNLWPTNDPLSPKGGCTLGTDTVFVIESCQNCNQHKWNTRHDEKKYVQQFNLLSQAIIKRVPNALIMRN